MIDKYLQSRRWLFLFFFLSAAPLLMLEAIKVNEYPYVSRHAALLTAAALAILAAIVLSFPSRIFAFVVRPTVAPSVHVLAAVPWLIWLGVIAYAHRVDAWDESAYILSGQAIRGYHVPYAAHSGPLTGLLCAAFVGADRFLNPVLVSALLIAMYLWMRDVLGPWLATLAVFVLLFQNYLLESTVHILSELPAAVLLLLGFLALAKERFWWSAVLFTLVVFTRWNLAPVWAVVFLAVFVRFGVRHAFKFVVVALAGCSIWYLLTVGMGTPSPVAAVYRGDYVPAIVWVTPEDRRLRAGFYLRHFFFLTPPALISLVASPAQNLRKHLATGPWTALVVLPLALLAYLVTMLNISQLYVRFMVPVIPLAVVSLLYWLSTLTRDLPQAGKVRLFTIAVFLTCASGSWPLAALHMVRANLDTPPIFSPELQHKLIALDRSATIYALPLETLGGNNGSRAMVEARHRILFPLAHLDYKGKLIEQPDTLERVRGLAKARRPGDFLLIPKQYASTFQTVLLSDEHWALVRDGSSESATEATPLGSGPGTAATTGDGPAR